MRFLLPRFALVPLALLVAPLSAELVTVGPPGSGSDFADVQAAIDAASAGDVVLVAPGTYPGFHLEKALVVQGAGRGATRITEEGFVLSPTLAVVREIDAGGVAVVAGMTIEFAGIAIADAAVVEIGACDGAVALHDLEVVAFQGLDGIAAQDSARFLLSDARAFGGGGSGAAAPAYSLATRNSGLWAIDSVIEAPALFTPFAPVQKETAFFDSSDVRLAGATVVGPSIEGGWAIEGGDAVWARAATIEIARSEVRGADASVPLPGGYALRLFQGSTATAYADSTVKGGLNGDGTTEQAPALVEPGSSYVTGPGPAPTLSVLQPRATGGEHLDLVLHGAPGATGQLLGSLGMSAGFAVPGADGDVFLDPTALVRLGPVTLGATGEATLSIPVPTLPPDAHWIAVFQCAETSAGPPAISNPALVSVF